MNKYAVTLLAIILSARVFAQSKFDIFNYTPPAGFILKENKGYLFYSKTEGKNYCQLFLYPATNGQNDVAKDFVKNWDFFARNPKQKINNPETKEADTINGWQTVFGAAKGFFNKQQFAISLSTFTKDSITYYTAAVFTDKKYIPIAQAFFADVVPDENKFVRAGNSNPPPKEVTSITTVGNNSSAITKSITNFDDGWSASITKDYVKLTKAATELRLHYIDKALDDARPNTIDAPEYYWNKYVEPYFTLSNVQKWSGVQYPVIYHLQADAVNKQTGKACFVAIKIVYNGGARPVVVISSNQNNYKQQFPHPNDIDPMLNANRFAITASDIIGTWKGGGGGGVEYYNAYSGTYAGMSTVSSTDEFTFNSNGTYSSKYRSAGINNGSTTFGGQDFNGNFSVQDWSITLTNRYGGKTTTYNAQLIAVRNGYLLYISDISNTSLSYMLYKAK